MRYLIILLLTISFSIHEFRVYWTPQNREKLIVWLNHTQEEQMRQDCKDAEKKWVEDFEEREEKKWDLKRMKGE